VTPEQFLSRLKRQEPAAAYLFAGPEPYRRNLCRRALVDRALSGEDPDEGLSHFDLQDVSLAAVVDEACSLSLFAPKRLIWASNAEAALPRGEAAAPPDLLLDYLKQPTPGTVLVLDVTRYEMEGEDKAKLERVRKFYSAVQVEVEFPRYSAAEARHLAAELAKAAGLRLDRDAVELLVESVGADAQRIATEIEKLGLYAGAGKTITAAELAALVPDSSVSTIFILVDALGRRDRLRALNLLDTLTRQGEYMPLALNFLATLLRLALTAKEKGLRGPQQIQQALSRPGRPIWRSRAEQIHQAATLFTKNQLEAALKRVFLADMGLRDARPDDRIVMEDFILGIADGSD
jgi:DNA polymerase III subunit delta